MCKYFRKFFAKKLIYPKIYLKYSNEPHIHDMQCLYCVFYFQINYCNLFENIICLSQDEPEELFLLVVRLIDLNSRWQQLVGVERMCVEYKGEQFELSWWALALTGNTGFVRGGYFAIADDSDRGSSATRRSQRAIRGCSNIGFQET